MSKFRATQVSIDRLIEMYEGLIPEVEEELRSMQITPRLPVPDVPAGLEDVVKFNEFGDPREPEDITTVTDEETGKLFSYYTAWTNYLQTELTNADCRRLTVKRSVRVVAAALAAHYKDELGTPANQVGEKVELDERFVAIDLEMLRSDVSYRQIESAYARCKRVLTLISREQTRRAEENNRESSSPDSRVKGQAGASKGRVFPRRK